MSGMYQENLWQVVVDGLGYPSIFETNEDGDPGDLVAHCFDESRAKQIAAAPDLYEALTKARNTLAGCGMANIAADICDAALAKAQGTEARRAETGTGSVHDGPVAKPCAPNQSGD